MWKRPTVVAPGFRQPATYNPQTGTFAPLGVPGIKSRVALMQVLEIHDDYLVCRGFDPEDNRFYNAVAVAKPYLLQKTPWDGRELTLPEGTLPDTVVTYDYPEGGNPWRTATYDNGTVEQQNISPPWFVGDVIAAVKPRSKLGDTPGTPTIVAETDELDLEWGILYDESNKPIHWMDLNVGGRTWTENLHGSLQCPLIWWKHSSGGATPWGLQAGCNATGYVYADNAIISGSPGIINVTATTYGDPCFFVTTDGTWSIIMQTKLLFGSSYGATPSSATPYVFPKTLVHTILQKKTPPSTTYNSVMGVSSWRYWFTPNYDPDGVEVSDLRTVEATKALQKGDYLRILSVPRAYDGESSSIQVRYATRITFHRVA